MKKVLSMYPLLILYLGCLPLLLFAQAKLYLPTAPNVVPLPLGWHGHNLSASARMSWVNHPDFAAVLPNLQPGLMRWPYGNPANNYDWFAGLSDMGGFHLARAAAFAGTWQTQLQAVVPYGNRSAAYAADLVRFCNSTDPLWVALRDSLLAHPDPLDIELWEIGNEVTTAWGFAWSWLGYQPQVFFRTGMPPAVWTQRAIDSLYFYGGSFPRFGWVQPLGGLNARTAILGDLRFVAQGTDTLVHRVRFPKLSANPDSLRVWVVPNMGPWNFSSYSQQQIYDLLTQPMHLLAQNQYAWDEYSLTLFPTGGLPDSTTVLIEYLTVGHDGAFAFLDAMRAADSSIRVGFCTRIDQLEDSPQFVADLKQHLPDFIVEHPYATNVTVPAANLGLYSELVHASEFKIDQMLDRYALWQLRAADWQLSHTPGLAITEWNVALCDDCPVPHPFRGMGGALYTARFQARLIELAARDSLALYAANHFALLASGQNFLHLFHVNGGQFSIGNEGWAMLMLMDVLREGVALLDSGIVDVPMIQLLQPNGTSVSVPAIEAWAGFDAENQMWHLLLLNSDSHAAYSLQLYLPQGYFTDSVYVQQLVGALDGSSLDWSAYEQEVDADSFTLTLPAYSLHSVAFRQMLPPVASAEVDVAPDWQIHLAWGTASQLWVVAQAVQMRHLQWHLWSLNGQHIATGQLQVQKGQAMYEVPVAVPLVQGLYVLQLVGAQGQQTLLVSLVSM